MTGRQFLYILIATFVTVAIWVTMDVLRSRSLISAPPEATKLLEPINPSFDQEAIDEL